MANPDAIPLLAAIQSHSNAAALIDSTGTHSTADLLEASQRIASALLADRDTLNESRVALLLPPGFGFVAALLAIWRAGGLAVPLSPLQSPTELRYVLHNCSAAAIIVDPSLLSRLPQPLPPTIRVIDSRKARKTKPRPLPEVHPDNRALMLYTSGTTSKPKGVVLSHANLAAQIRALETAWEWRPDDRIVHVLPLHHIHGLVNALCCALWAGATCDILPKFDAENVWQRFMTTTATLFMAVPTIYAKLIAAWEAATPEQQAAMASASRNLRLMVSGSAALPQRIFNAWQQISGQPLLERYGMTEIGMALANPLHGERRPGTVGMPLPGVEVRMVDDAGAVVEVEGEAGEIEVRGAGVFREYWQRPEATWAAFRDGWFRTGDVAMRQEGYYRILGRRNVDIIKTGGYKVSALEIEEVLRAHPAIRECAVVGVPDAEWGECISVAVVLRDGSAPPNLEELQAWSREQLARYKWPRSLLVLPALPRNALGKVLKPAVQALFADG